MLRILRYRFISCLVTFQFFACENIQDYNTYFPIPSTTDSIWQDYQSYPNKKRRERLRVIASRLNEQGNYEQLEDVLVKEYQRIKEKGSDIEELDLQLHYLKLFQLKRQSQSWDSLVSQIQTKTEKLDYHQYQYYQSSLGGVAYTNRNLDSALHCYDRIYQRSAIAMDSIYQFMSLLNLGAIHFQREENNKALAYFKKAYALDKSLGMNHPILLNNLAACYTRNIEFGEALRLLESRVKTPDGTTISYSDILLRLSYVQVLQCLQNWELSRTELSYIDTTRIPKDLYFQWVSVNALDRLVHNDGLKSFIQDHQNFINENRLPLFLRMFNSKVSGVKSESWKDFQQYFLKNTNLESQLMKRDAYMPLYNWYRLQLMHTQLGESRKKLLLEKANTALMRYLEKKSELGKSSLKAQLLMIEKETEAVSMRRKQKIIELEKERSNMMNGMLTLVIIALLIVVALGYSLSKKRTQFLTEQLENKQRETQLLNEKAELNERNTMLTKAVMEKSRTVAKALKGLNIRDENLSRVARELEQVGLLKASIKEIHDSSILLESEWTAAVEKYPVLADLKETEQKIFLMGNKGVKPKDISIALDISYQYTRNVRSKIRGLLGIDSKHKLDRLV